MKIEDLVKRLQEVKAQYPTLEVLEVIELMKLKILLERLGK